MTSYSSPAEIQTAHDTLCRTFKSLKTKSIAWRKWQLKQLWWLVSDNESAIAKALHADLHRHDFESYYADIGAVKQDILTHLKDVEAWAADEKPDAGFIFGTLGGARIRKEPIGVALIIGTWNFPFVVTLAPLTAAITAGCCILVKPAETSVACQNLMADLIPKYLDEQAIKVVTGGPQETTRILEKRFDKIFYTGSTRIAKIIQTAAAKHLTPTVLELGGQAPCIVTSSANLDVAAKRIMFSKYLNAGQICLSSNHVFVDPIIHDEFVERCKYWIGKYLSDGGESQVTRIINERNYDRIISLLDQSNGSIAFGGNKDRSTRFIQPTIVTNVDMNDSLLSEELFGPLLPIMALPYQEACAMSRKMEHPLGLYIFSNDKTEIDYILDNTTSGGVTINEVMFHAAVPDAPFGGVGDSGTGSYHGKYGFEAFTHKRTVVSVPSWLDNVLGFRYPPYSEGHIDKVTVKKVSFVKGETMADQKVGPSVKDKTVGALRIAAKWGAVALLFAYLDAAMGGRPKIQEVVQGAFGNFRSRLSLGY